MDGQGNFRPNLYSSYNNQPNEAVSGADPRAFINQPVFPGGHRQFSSYSAVPTNYGPTDFLQGFNAEPMNFSRNSATASEFSPMPYHGFPNIGFNSNLGDLTEARNPGSQNVQVANELYTNRQGGEEKVDSCALKFDDKSKIVNKLNELPEKQKQPSTAEIVIAPLTKSISFNEKNVEKLAKDDIKDTALTLGEKSDKETDIVKVKEEPLSEDEADNKNTQDTEEGLYDESTDTEGSLSDSDTDSEKEKPKKKQRGKAKGQNLLKVKAVLPKKPTVYTCDVCGKVVKSLRAKEKHKNLHTEKFKCDKCSKILNSLKSLKNHEKVHSGFKGDDICNVCDKKFYDKSSLNKHTLSVHMGIKNFQCEYCNLEFFARKTYMEHVRVHTGDRPFKCDRCPKSYKRVSDLNHHIRLHNGEVSHTCERCGEGFRRTSELKRHMKTKHNSDSPIDPEVRFPTKSKTCSFCGLIFSTLKALNEHISTHMDFNGRLIVPETRPRNQHAFENKTMVNEIVSELGTNLTTQNEVIHKETNLNTQNHFLDKSFDNDNILNKTGSHPTFGNAVNDVYTATNMNIFPSISDLSLRYQKESNEIGGLDAPDLGSLFEQNSVGEGITKDSNTTDTLPESFQRLNNQGVDDDYDDNDDDVGSDDGDDDDDFAVNIKSEIEIVNDLDEYGGETDVEDYNYVMNDSTLPLESSVKTEAAESNSGAKTEKVKKRNKQTGKGQKSKNNDSDVKTPTNKRKRTLKKPQKVVRKKTAKKLVGTTMDTTDDDADVDNDIDSTGNDSDYKPPINKRKRKMTKPQKRASSSKKSNKKLLDTSIESSDKNDDDGDNLDDFDTSGETSPGKDGTPVDFTCKQCGKKLSNKISLDKHMNLHLGTFSCEVCGKCFSKKKSLDIHMDNHEGKKSNTSKCNVCDKSFYDNSSLNKHVKAVHMDYKPYPCPECDRRFSERKTLTEHLRVHSGERPFACEICGKTYKRAGELNFHIRKHGGEVKVNCDQCGKGFMRMGLLRQHMQMKHDKEKPYRCFMCHKTFPTIVMLSDHKQEHVKDKNHVCEKCGARFYTITKLRKHMRRKTDCQSNNYCINGVYACKFCYQEFDSFHDRKVHIDQNHANDSAPKKTYPCQICGNTFSRPQGLKIHLKIHLNVRDYHCTQCDASFIQKHHLTQHMTTHTGVKEYQCSICLKTFAHNATLYNHMKHHNILTQT